MYQPVKIDQLSQPQISKLLAGQPVRIKHNPQGPHTIHVSAEQGKKLNRATMKGSGMTITFDPYQVDQHRNATMGDGLNLGKIFKGVKNFFTSDVGKAVGKFAVNKALDLAPVPQAVKNLGKDLSKKAFGSGVPAVPQFATRKKVGRPRKAKKQTGGAMFPAGYSF